MKRKIKIGAIRWDAWVGEKNPVGLEIERVLSNPKYYERLPFYSTLNNGNVHIRCDTKEIIIKEIQLAYDAGINYFAFCWYPFGSGLETARNLFLEVEQSKVKWCLILGTNPFSKQDAQWLIRQFKSNNYQKINNRPIIYLFNVNEELLDIVTYIRKIATPYHPYFIGLVWNTDQAKTMTRKFKLDAISQYCTPGQNHLNYTLLSQKEIRTWHEYSKINTVIPWITTGWDKRPRFETPVSWEDCSNFDHEYIESPNRDQLANELEAAIKFQANKQGDLILIYAWNEFDEGGYIEPTLLKNGKINKMKLSTIKNVIHQYNG